MFCVRENMWNTVYASARNLPSISSEQTRKCTSKVLQRAAPVNVVCDDIFTSLETLHAPLSIAESLDVRDLM